MYYDNTLPPGGGAAQRGRLPVTQLPLRTASGLLAELGLPIRRSAQRSEAAAFVWLLTVPSGYRPWMRSHVYMDGRLAVVKPLAYGNEWYFDDEHASRLVLDGEVLKAHDQQGFEMEFLRRVNGKV